MSFSEVTVLRIAAPEIFRASTDIEAYALGRMVSAPEMSSDDWEQSAQRAMAIKIQAMSTLWLSKSTFYAARYIDNDSVGGDSIHVLRALLQECEKVRQTAVIADDYLVLLLMAERGDFTEIGQFKRRAAMKVPNMRPLLFNVAEAARAFVPRLESGIIVIHHVLGPTRDNWGG